MMTFIISYEDGPCAIDCKTIVVEARSAEAAQAIVEKRNPRAMITSVEIVESLTRCPNCTNRR